MEKLIKQILKESISQTHNFKIFGDGTIEGDVEKLKKDMMNYKITFEDTGIGTYDYGSSKGYDTKLKAEIENNCTLITINDLSDEGNKIEDLVDAILSEKNIPKEIEQKDSVFKLKIKNVKIEKNTYTCLLCYE